MDKHNNHEFCIIVIKDKFTYLIMDKEVDRKILLISDELFDSEFQANMAAIGNIELLEKGE